MARLHGAHLLRSGLGLNGYGVLFPLSLFAVTLGWLGILNVLAPLSHPRLSPAPPGGKEEPTATCGHVSYGGKTGDRLRAGLEVAATDGQTGPAI